MIGDQEFELQLQAYYPCFVFIQKSNLFFIKIDDYELEKKIIKNHLFVRWKITLEDE